MLYLLQTQGLDNKGFQDDNSALNNENTAKEKDSASVCIKCQVII